jgi:GR25 family glycosyltransferase involved in LPS biosynthesis
MLLDNIWIINLDKSTDRFERIKKNMESLNLKYNRFSAIYGKDITQEDLDNDINGICKTLLCNYGTIGCAASHKKLWSQLIDSDVNEYIILEDDALLTQKSIDIISKLKPYIEKYNIDYLNLVCINYGCSLKKTEFKIDEYEFGKPYIPLQTCGYIITKNGAKKLLDIIKNTTYHVDFEILYVKLMYDLNYYSTTPRIIDMFETPTTIGAKRTSLSIEFLNGVGLPYIAWCVNTPTLTFGLNYEINILTIILLILLILNTVKFKSTILLWFIIFEIFILYSIYL